MPLFQKRTLRHMIVKVCLGVIQLVNRAWNARERAQYVCVGACTHACTRMLWVSLSIPGSEFSHSTMSVELSLCLSQCSPLTLSFPEFQVTESSASSMVLKKCFLLLDKPNSVLLSSRFSSESFEHSKSATFALEEVLG